MNSTRSLLAALAPCGLALAFAASTAHAAPRAAAMSGLPAGRVVLPGGVTPTEYRVAIEVHPDGAQFDGRVDIDIRVARATGRIVLNSADLQIARATIDDRPEPAAVTFDTQRETATLAWGRRVSPGAHVLHIDYQGKIHVQAKGLFKVSYDTPGGRGSALATQLEPADARRLLPCWDEPALRAVFRLTATLPAESMAIGNMPIEHTERLAGGRKRVRFAATPRMSTYLLFYGEGDFERVHRNVGGVDVGVIAKRGSGASAELALDAATGLLAYYNDYFGVPYPLPKLDLVAAPGQSTEFGAMENWGAIFFFERDLLVDPHTATESDRQGVFNVVAHEMAHQWFGDLVTMAWWDDLWLNEGFATWMQSKAADHMHPEWKRWLRVLARKQRVMDTDARDGSHPVVTRIDDVVQAATAFDGITYQKGAQVIRTLEAWLGEAAFREGVRRYMHRHAYGNTLTEDFWRAMDAGGGPPITAIAHDLTLQTGVPLITERSVRCEGGRTTVLLSQSHFAIDAGSTAATLWRVPVTLAIPGGASARVLVSGPDAQAVTLAGCGPVVINAGQTSYFRSRYSDAGLQAVLAHYADLAPDDQLGLFNDSVSLAFSRDLPMATLMAVLAAVPANADPRIVSAVTAQLVDIDALYRGLPTQPAWRAFAAHVLAPMLAAVGPLPVAGEGGNAVIARADLMAALAEFDDPALLADARREFAAYAADPAAAVDPERRKFFLTTVASHADGATWDALHALAMKAPTEMEKQELHELMASTISPELAARMLAFTRSGEPPSTTVTSLIWDVGVRHPALAFDHVLAHWDELVPLFDPGNDVDYLPGILSDAPDAALATRLQAWGEAHIAASARKSLRDAVSNMTWRAAIRRDRLPEIDRWLAGRAQARP